MKRLSHLFFILFTSSVSYAQVASRLIASQALPVDSAAMNVMFVDTVAGAMNRTWVARTSSLRFRTRQIRGLKDSVALFTAPLYKPMSYVPSWNQITSKPTFSAVSFSGNYADLLSKPTIPAIPSNVSAFVNDAGYLVTVPAQSWASITNKPSFAAVATSGSYSDLSGTPTITNYTAGAGISIAAGVITNTSPNQVVSLTAGTGMSVTGAYPSYTLSASSSAVTFNNAPGRTVGTSFQVSTTRPARVSYTVSCVTALSLLNLNSNAQAFLEISANNSTWVTVNAAGSTKTLAVSLSVGINETSLFNVQCEIPAGWWVRIRSVTSGGGSVTFSSGQEAIY